MAKEKKPVHKVQMTEGKRNIIRQLLQEYDIETASDIQDALKDLLGGTKTGAMSSHPSSRMFLTCAPVSVKSIAKGYKINNQLNHYQLS